MLLHIFFVALALALLLPTLPLVTELLVLSIAALGKPRQASHLQSSPLRLAVVVPAHNEQQLITRCVHSLRASQLPPAEIFVVAHNCTDATAQAAADAGATVLALVDDGARGKGAALDFGFTHALQHGADAVLVIDADSYVSSTLTQQTLAAFAKGAEAVQARYIAESTATGERAQLLALALYGMNVLRPRGRNRLGLSCGIFGNGFAVSAATLQRVPYTAHSVVEDLEYHLALVRKGVRVRFLDDAEVFGEMPDNSRAAGTQRARWEGGRARMRRDNALPLLGAVLRGKFSLLEPLLDLLSLPIGTVAALLVASLLIPIAAARVYAAVGLLALGLYVVVSAMLSREPARMLRAVLAVPKYLLFKLLLMPATRRAAKKRSAWVRTERNSATAAAAPGAAGRE